MRREDVLAICEGKVKLTFERAKKIANKRDGRRRDFYKCPCCRRWHVGRRPK
jgi:predicted methyltransferase